MNYSLESFTAGLLEQISPMPREGRGFGFADLCSNWADALTNMGDAYLDLFSPRAESSRVKGSAVQRPQTI